jgi:iron(II)-dependent oxidoreductase
MNLPVQEPHTLRGRARLQVRTAWALACVFLFCFLPALAPAAPVVSSSSMIHIPDGDFIMGSSEEDIQWAAKTFFSESLDYYLEETPAHRVQLDAFEIDRHEVTVAEYRNFMQATGRPAPKYLDNPKLNQSTQPVVGVTWQDAADYCEWAGKRLPSEAEWEKAARGTDRRYYPWGNDPDPTRTNVRGLKDGYRYTAPVGAFPNNASPYGVMDMAGNVWEWTADWFQPYPGNTTPSELYGTAFKVMRGGSWFSNMDLARTAVRGKLPPDQRQNYIGFRCAR